MHTDYITVCLSSVNELSTPRFHVMKVHQIVQDSRKDKRATVERRQANNAVFVVAVRSHLHPANGHQPQQLVAPEANGEAMSIAIALTMLTSLAGLGAPQRIVPR